jgi:hypothetical protein
VGNRVNNLVKSTLGELFSLTENGLPERIRAPNCVKSVGILLKGWISQYTFNSLTLRAIN